MAQTINTNVASLNAQRNLSMSQGSLATSLQRLSSGLRINSAKDDAAGLAVSQRMNSQIRSLNQAVRNANDGISMLQTAESATNEIQSMLQRMKELGTQAANDTISGSERKYINTELQQLKDEINDIAEKTTFNGQKILSGALSTKVDATTELNVGSAVGAAAITSIDVSSAKAGTTYSFTGDTTSDTLTLSDGNGNTQTLSVSALSADSTNTLNFSNLGVKVTLGSQAGETADNLIAGLTGAADTIVTSTGSAAVTLQVGSGTTTGIDTLDLSFASAKIDSSNTNTQTLATALDNFNTSSNTGTGEATGAQARALMTAVDSALDFFSNQRASYGAAQNRLDSTISNLQATSENLSASRGRIVDADFAQETANLTRGQILQQAGTAMLAQANSLPQGVLSLLRG